MKTIKIASTITLAGGLVLASASAAWAAKTPAQCGLTTIDPSSGVVIEDCINLAYRPGDVWVHGDFAYVASRTDSTVHVYDISNPGAISLERTIAGPAGATDLIVSDVVVGDNDVVYISYYCTDTSCTPVHKNAEADACASPFASGTLANPAVDTTGRGIHNLKYDPDTGTLFGAYLAEGSMSFFDGVHWWDVGTTSCGTGNFSIDGEDVNNEGGTHDMYIHNVGGDKFLYTADEERIGILDITDLSNPGLVGLFNCSGASTCNQAHTVWAIDDKRFTLAEEYLHGRLVGLYRSGAGFVQKGAHTIPPTKADSYHQQIYENGFLYAAAYQAGVRVWRRDPLDHDLSLYAYFDTTDHAALGNNNWSSMAGAFAAHPAGASASKRFFAVTQHDGTTQNGSNDNQLYLLSISAGPTNKKCGPGNCQSTSAGATPVIVGGPSMQKLIVARGSDDGGPGQAGALHTYAPTGTGFSSPVTLSQGSLVTGHGYGHSLAIADFDSDGYVDVAVGAPGQTTSSIAAGVVYVYRGGATGFTAWTTLTQATGSLGSNTAGDQFGFALAAGDFDGDGYPDLAVGAPDDTEPTSGSRSGGVYVYSGSATGLVADVVRYPDSPLAEDDRFGSALASGDFDADTYVDLAVGAPRARYGATDPYSGVVFVYRGSASGPTLWGRKGQSGLDTDEAGDDFGAALAVGDFNGDGKPDLAVGARDEHLSDISSGAVYAFLGSATGVLSAWRRLDQTGIDTNEEEDMFGRRLIAGDFTGDGKADLAVGAPGEMPGSSPRSGAVHVFEGGTGGFRARNTADQSTLATNDDQEAFGEQLAVGDFDGDGKADLAVVAPGLGGGTLGNPLFAYRGATTGVSSWITVTVP